MEARPGLLVGGRYRLIAELGSGGFGRVWRAYDDMLHVDVAVKELQVPASASAAEQSDRVARAAREARNAAPLRDHPNIVAVHDVVVDDGIPWIVMQLVDGCSIDDHVKARGPLPPEKVAEVAVAMLRALGAAHDAGILHRDVKPANVLLADTGEVLLTDFGIAVHHTDTVLTATGVFIGSMEYVAPERALGKETTAASDLFALGATLYYAVEGVSPFRRGEDIATLGAVLSQDPPPMRLAPPGLATLITRLLAKEPKRRPTVRQAIAMLIEQPTDNHRVTEDHAVLLTRAVTVMKLELGRRLLALAAEHSIDLAPARPTVVIPPKKTPTTKLQPSPAQKRTSWQRVGSYVIFTLLLVLAYHGAVTYGWGPDRMASLLGDRLGSITWTSRAGVFLWLSGLAIVLLVALPLGVAVSRRARKAVAAAGKMVTFLVGLIVGVVVLVLAVAVCYYTVAGGVDMLAGSMGPPATLWTSFVASAFAVIIAYEWSSTKRRTR